MTTYTYYPKGTCSKQMEVDLEDGVIKDVKVDLPKKEVTVIYDASKNNDENIVKGFATIKVKAEPKKAPAKK